METLPTDWQKMHHAYIVSGFSPETLWLFLRDNLSYAKIGNPDALELQFDTFGIDESRALVAWALAKPFAGGRKVAVIAAETFTSQAQNSLLKLFEEPGADTHFFVLAPEPKIFLPTLLSRVHTVIVSNESQGKIKASKFLKALVGERLKMVASIVKSKNKKEAKEFVSAILAVLQSADVKTKKASLPTVLQSLRFLSSRSPSIKMILEHLSLVLPKLS